MKNKQKIALIVGCQIGILVASFMILVHIENEWLVLGNSIDKAGLNRYLAASSILEAHNQVYSYDTVLEENSVDKLRKNLEDLRYGIDNEGIKLRPLPIELIDDWNKVYDSFVVFEQDVKNFQISSDQKIHFLNKLDDSGKKLVESSDI